MEKPDELFEIGGPMILEELEQDKRVIESKELSEVYMVTEVRKLVLQKLDDAICQYMWCFWWVEDSINSVIQGGE